MIKIFEIYIKKGFIEEVELSPASICGEDYIEEYDCILKDRYRNLKTGEIKKLEEIFTIPGYHEDNFFGIWNDKGDLKILNYTNGYLRTDNKLRFNIKKFKNGKEIVEMTVGPEILDVFYHHGEKEYKGKGKYNRLKNHNKIVFEKQRIKICNIWKYCADFRHTFAGRIVDIYDHKLGGDGVEKTHFRVPDRFDYHNETGVMSIRKEFFDYNKTLLNFNIRDYVRGGEKNYRVNIFDTIKARPKIKRINPVEDPYGEEDWSDEIIYED